MTKEETLEIVNKIIDESADAMKKEAVQLLNSRDWDFDQFGDRNTFVRAVLEALFMKEKDQYAAIDPKKAYKKLRCELAYELSFIHP